MGAPDPHPPTRAPVRTPESYVEALLHRCVDVGAGEDAEHLLVQRDREAVVVALGEARQAVVLLACADPVAEHVLVSRALAARHRDADEVWLGLATDAVHLVVVGQPPSADWVPHVAPPHEGFLRPVAFHHLALDGTLRSPEGTTLDALVEAARSLEGAATAPAPDLEVAERTGERALARLARFRIAFGSGRASVAWALVASWAVMLGVQALAGGLESTPTLFRLGALSRPEIVAGEWWRLFAASMLHGGGHHLVGNTYAVLVFGAMLEGIVGRSRVLLTFVASVVAGGVASVAMRDGGLSIGASGGTFGLMGAALGLSIGGRSFVPMPERRAIRRLSVIYIVLNALFSLLPGIDWAAHAGGFFAGFAVAASGLLLAGLPLPGEPPSSRWPRVVVGAVACVAAAVLPASVAVSAMRWDVAELVGSPSLVRSSVEVGGRVLSLDLPRGVSTRASPPETDEGFARLSWGRPGVDPIRVSVLAWVVDPPPDDPRAYLEEEVVNFKPVEPEHDNGVQWVEVDGRPFLFRAEGDGRHPMVRWRGVVGHHLVDLLVGVMPDARDKWTTLPDRLVRSLESR